MRTRLSWMVSGPARLGEIERSIVALQQQLDQLVQHQERELDTLRTQVRATLDDIEARADRSLASGG